MPTLFASGHLTDATDRLTRRFPQEELERVAYETRRALRGWNVDEDWTVITGGARGADIITASIALDLGANVHVHLAMPEPDFIERSVTGGLSTEYAEMWLGLFECVLVNAGTTTSVLPADRAPVDPTSPESFARANDWMLDRLAQDTDRYGLLVWDGRGGTGVGGTWQVAQRLEALTGPGRTVVIDPAGAR